MMSSVVLGSSLLALSGLITAFSVSSSPAIDNRDVYVPVQRRLTSDIFNSNVTYVNQYSRPHTTGLTNDVAWDRYSLYIKSQRVFVYSGEFHPWRLPVPDLWRDVLQKMKAGGSNAVSIYIPWHLIEPSEGVLEMKGINNYQSFFDIAKEVGIFVIARPGPFINGETSGGGIPAWAIRKSGTTRTNSTTYAESWPKYVDAITSVIAQNEISRGGPVILVQVENEFATGPNYNPHMIALREAFRRNGISTPLTHNNARGRGYWGSGDASVDISAIDAYPAGFSCTKPDNFPPLVTAFKDWSERVNRDAPYYFAEIQGGSFDPWGGNGYGNCYKMTSENFERVQTQYLLENRVTLINKYMFFGGTNWGGLAAPVVYTS